MTTNPRTTVPTGQAWIDQFFDADAVQKGGIVRRSVADVQKYASEQLLVAEVKRRGFHLLISGNQYVVLCHGGHVVLVC